MRESAGVSLAGWLLLLGPVLGLVPVGNPALVRIWSMPPDQHAATVAAHRTGWTLLNAGFAVATVGTAAGIAALAVTVRDDPGLAAGVLACAVAYTVGGVLWVAVLAIRTRTTPLRAQAPAEPGAGEPLSVVEAATGALFDGFVAITSVAIALLGLVLLLTGAVAALVAVAAMLAGAGMLAWLLVAGDVIPAALYAPTVLLGFALLAGWS